MSKSKYFLAALAATAMGTVAVAQDANPWQIRGRILSVMPDESGDLSLGGAALAGDVDIETGYVPELDITYFFTENLAAELILGVTPHDVEATGVVVPGVVDEPTNVDLGDVTLLPPTLTLQYHFKNESQFTPYIGAGLNYTLFFNEDSGSADSIDYDESFGGALQVGFDYDMDGVPGGWLLNVDVKKIWINTDVDVQVQEMLALEGPTTVNADVDINPLVVGVGFGYKY